MKLLATKQIIHRMPLLTLTILSQQNGDRNIDTVCGNGKVDEKVI